LSGGYTGHHHGIPTCLVVTLDGTSGPSHLLGFALDGFPIYGGRDIDGNVIVTSQLDACNGITSATPEFPSGAYHYVLPYNTTGRYSSFNCYVGTVSNAQMAAAKKLICNMKSMKESRVKAQSCKWCAELVRARELAFARDEDEKMTLIRRGVPPALPEETYSRPQCFLRDLLARAMSPLSLGLHFG
jgi:hypothetical protein